MSDAHEKVVYHGKLMDKKGRAFIMAMEKKLGYELTITQGNYNPGGVSESGGTHDGGGVFDLPSWDWERKLRVAKDLGAWGWFRPTIAGLWNEHIHFGITDHGTLAAQAQTQQKAYFARRSGLVSNAYDGSYRASPVPIFKYVPDKPEPIVPAPTNVSLARDQIVEAMHAAGEARALLMKAPKERTVVWAHVARLELQIDEFKDILKNTLPKR